MKKLLFFLALVHLIPLMVFAWTEMLGISAYTSNQFMISVGMFMSGALVLSAIDVTETYKSLEREHKDEK